MNPQILPLLRGAVGLLSEGKGRSNNPILKTPDLEDKIHVEEAEEEEQDHKQPSHPLCAPLFNRCHPSNWPWPEKPHQIKLVLKSHLSKGEGGTAPLVSAPSPPTEDLRWFLILLRY